MNTVRDIFRMIGAEGMTLYTVKKTLERKRIKPPGSGRFWHINRIRDII